MTFYDVLKYLKYYIPEDLISSEKFDNLCRVFNNFPGDITNEFGFESILSNPEPSADFSLKIKNEKILDLFNIQDENINDLKKMIDTGIDFKSLWLEYDNIRTRGFPGIFIETTESMNIPDIFSITNSFNRNSDKSFIINFIGGYRDCIKYIGYFKNRNPSVIRFCLEFNDNAKLIDFVNAHYSQEFTDSTLYNELSGMVDSQIVNVDINQDILPSLSIEFSHNVISSENQKRWHSFLDVLCDNDLCNVKKCSALKKWYGDGWEIFNPVLCKYHTYRLINHFKISIKSGGKLAVKAYYGFSNSLR